MGPKAHAFLTRHGVHPNAFTLMLAASGGPRWLGIVGIDRALAPFLRQRTKGKLAVLGASSGAWRLAALAADEGGKTYDELEQAYIGQCYHGQPSPKTVSQTCRAYLEALFTPTRIDYALRSSIFQLNLTTTIVAQANPSRAEIITRLMALAFLNACSRRLMGLMTKRGLFIAGHAPLDSPLSLDPSWDRLPTRPIALNRENFVGSLLASGSIPLVLQGECHLPGAGLGHHLDGGLIDYHFQVEHAQGPILYPHFSAELIPGWFDRFPPRRRITRQARDWLCLILPTPEQIARYPDARLPGREDFSKLTNTERIRRWEAIVRCNNDLERELTACLDAEDLLTFAQPL